MFKNLSLVQKAMVLVYKGGGTLPFLEKYVQEVAQDRKKMDVQQAYADAHKSLIGDEEQRRRYWIEQLTKE